MSCDAAAAASFLMFAALGGPAAPSAQPVAVAAPAPVSGLPLFKDIIGRADRLKAEVETARSGLAGAAAPLPLPGGDAFAADIGQLSALDQQGSDWIRQNRTGDDLKCILHGISQDLPVKLAALKDAKTAHDEDLALRDMFYLLRDNVEVITAPPEPAA
jgi:hypothetical protein